MSKKRKFTWDAWDYDLDGSAYIIAKDECPNKEDVPDYICRVDGLSPECKPEMVVDEGWCAWQVRTDWMYGDGEPHGWYVVEKQQKRPARNGKPLPGWFPVWIVRKGEWY